MGGGGGGIRRVRFKLVSNPLLFTDAVPLENVQFELMSRTSSKFTLLMSRLEGMAASEQQLWPDNLVPGHSWRLEAGYGPELEVGTMKLLSHHFY